MSQGMPESVKSVINWVLAIGIIAFILLIMVIIFGNLSGNVGFGQDSTSFDNETILLDSSGATPATAQNRVNGVLTNVVITNASEASEIIPATNYTVSGVIITINGTSVWDGINVNVTAALSFDEQGKIDADNIINNYTKSATNTSAQFPTVGTIIGIAILLLILIALLIFVIKKMMAINTGSEGSGKRSFSGSDRDFG